MSAGSTSNGSTAVTLKSKRDALPKGEKQIVKRVVDAFEERLIDAIGELVGGLENGRQSSFSATMALKMAKGRNVSVIVAPRVRAPRESTEFEVHLTDDRQLEMGWLDVEEDEDDDRLVASDEDDFASGEVFHN